MTTKTSFQMAVSGAIADLANIVSKAVASFEVRTTCVKQGPIFVALLVQIRG